MRLASICYLIAAIMLVTVAVASRTSSHKEESSSKRQHRQHQVAAELMMRQRSWNNLTSSFGEEELEVPHLETRKKKKSSNRSHKEWTANGGSKKHKRKMASLASMAEQDRRLSLLHLPQMPPSSTRYPTERSGHPSGLECCPTVVEMVQPSGGTNMDGHVVELYRHGDLDQRIYEHSCRPDVLDQPCRFVEKLLRPLSRCVQQYSFTYAVVADGPGGSSGASDWRLDYIRIRNGCACEIQPP